MLAALRAHAVPPQPLAVPNPAIHRYGKKQTVARVDMAERLERAVGRNTPAARVDDEANPQPQAQ